jgi:hypothetical protein
MSRRQLRCVSLAGGFGRAAGPLTEADYAGIEEFRAHLRAARTGEVAEACDARKTAHSSNRDDSAR